IVMMLAAATDASDAGVWDRALASPADEAARKGHTIARADGATATMTSPLQSASPQAKIEAVRRAEAAYRAAAEARPRESEPYFRIGNLVHQTYFECEPTMPCL